MNEPSVLDYFKSIFKDWKSFTAFLSAVSERADTTQLVEPPAAEGEAVPAAQPATVSDEAPAPEAEPIQPKVGLPWRSLLALLLALFGQRMFEPPTQSAPFGVSLYIAAFALALWAYLRGEWQLTPLPAAETSDDPQTIRGTLFVMSLVFEFATFFTMGNNRFTSLNMTLWALTIVFHIWALWVKEPQSIWKRIADFFSRTEWSFRITRWGLLILAIVGVTFFFRVYHLSTVPPEMTSDHAEKLMDVFDITNGMYSIFFPRNTGREPMYIYLSALIAGFTGISFLTIKIAAVIGGLLMLPYLYLLGKELGSERIGLLAVAFAGIAYWPNVIERFALRISFYPLFVAPVLYYLIRGLRRQNRNDFILAGVALGLGLNGYTPFRIMPFAVVAIVIVYLLHNRDKKTIRQTLLWLFLLALTSWVFFIPLARYATEHPDIFGYRAFSRLGSVERPLPGPVWQLFLGNLWNALKEFNWNNGVIWVHSIPGRPALDVVSGALFLLGAFLLIVRYIRTRHWTDLTLLLAVPLTQMPSILSLAFPDENPSLNRTAGAVVPVFLIVGMGLESLLTSLNVGKKRAALVIGLAGILFTLSSVQNYDLVFRQYNDQYTMGAWNTHDMGNVIKKFMDAGGPPDNAWVVPYPFWVDTRLPPMWAGIPGRDIAKPREAIPATLNIPGPKLFIVDQADADTVNALQSLYPQGKLDLFQAAIPAHNFYIFNVPAAP